LSTRVDLTELGNRSVTQVYRIRESGQAGKGKGTEPLTSGGGGKRRASVEREGSLIRVEDQRLGERRVSKRQADP